MAELTRVSKTGLNITVPAEVLTFTYTGSNPREVIARVDVGIGTGVLTGLGGTYVLDFYIDGVLITPSSQIIVPVGETKTIMVGRSIPLEPGDVVSITVTGTAGDTGINTIATLRDSTPILESEIKGTGSVLVDHDTGGTNTFQVVTTNGSGIIGATISAYKTVDYNAGNRSSSAVRGQATTDSNGHWLAPMELDPDSYVFVFSKQAEFTTNTRTVVVPSPARSDGPVALTPISPDATGTVTIPEYTSDGSRVERPAVPSHENCAICTKRQQVQSMKGELIAVEWTFRNENGAPINLTIIVGTTAADETSESLVSESVAAVAETFTVEARFSECDRSGDILEITGKIIDTLKGVVQFKVPPKFACESGIYKLQIAMVRVSDKTPVLINSALWSVEEGLWGDTTNRSGVPSLSEIRIHMRDTSVENDLLDDVEFDDEEIVHAIVRPVDQWNETPPPVAPFTCRTFPFRYHWLNAVVGELMKTGAHHYMRNNLKMDHAGLSGNFKDKYREYLAVAKMYQDEWTAFIVEKKVSINAEMAYGSQGSPYSRSQW